ncbi:MAG: histidine phosphatase family protein [Lachnospiraceae bacterium]|nr:histidine phosphatase family protein [Lachnospiraceae bacterium]
MKIRMIRHGMTTDNEMHRYSGASDSEISKHGAVDITSRAATGYYGSYNGEKVYISSKVRALETLKIIFPEADYTVDARLDEMNFGVFEGKTYEELKSDKAYQTWISGDNLSNICPGGESFVQLRERVLEAWKKITDRGEDAILITHNGPIVAIREIIEPDPALTFYDRSIKNGEMVVADLSENHH